MKKAFVQVKDQIGPCGITCGTCDLGNGTVAETALKLNNYLKMYGVSSWGEQVPGWSDIDFESLNNSLDWIQTYTRCFGCEQGGGPPDCAIKSCAKDKGYELCSQCSELDDCTKFDWLGDYGQKLKKTLTDNKGKSKKEVIYDAISGIEP